MHGKEALRQINILNKVNYVKPYQALDQKILHAVREQTITSRSNTKNTKDKDLTALSSPNIKKQENINESIKGLKLQSKAIHNLENYLLLAKHPIRKKSRHCNAL